MPIDNFTAILRQAVEKLGRKIDVIILDSCYMANLEAMRAICPYAHFAVASTDGVPPKGLRLDRVLQHVPDKPEDVAMSFLQAEPRASYPVSVIRLDHIPFLGETVDRLGAALHKAAAGDEAEAVREAFRQTPPHGEAFGNIDELLDNLLSRVSDANVRVGCGTGAGHMRISWPMSVRSVGED